MIWCRLPWKATQTSAGERPNMVCKDCRISSVEARRGLARSIALTQQPEPHMFLFRPPLEQRKCLHLLPKYPPKLARHL